VTDQRGPFISDAPVVELAPKSPDAPVSASEIMGAHWTLSRQDDLQAPKTAEDEAYKPIVEALRGPRAYSLLDNLLHTSPYQNPSAPMDDPSPYDRNKIWRDIAERRAADPTFLANVPAANPRQFSDWVHAEELKRRHTAQNVVGRQSGWTQGALGFVSDVVSGLADPINAMTLPIGGGGKTILQTMGREALVNSLTEAAELPVISRNRAEMGEHMSVGDMVTDVGTAAIGGALLPGGLHVAGKALDAGGKALGAAGRAIAGTDIGQAVGRTVAPLALRTADLGKVSDGEVAAAFSKAVPAEVRTPDQQAALHVIDRQSEIDAINPYVDTPTARDVHADRLQSALATLAQAGDPDGIAPALAPRSPVSQTVSRETVATALTPDRVIGFVLHDLEGGNAVVHYSQADGGTTKFGIAQKFNPGVDVANLSEAEARAIAHRKYWLPEFDHVDPRTAAVAFDAQYIGGAGERILRESGGDPARAIEAYRTYLNHLADTVPGKEKFRRGWNNRVDKLAALIGGDERLALRPDVSGDGDAVAASQRAIDDAETEARIAAFERDRAMGNTPEALPPEPRMASAADIGPLERSGIDPQTYGGNIANGDGATPQPLPPRTNLPDAPVANDVDIRNAVRAYVTQTRESLKPEIMAERLGIERDAVKAALNAIADLPGIGLRQRRPGVFARQQDAAPRDLLGFLADHGGIRNDEGHDLIKGRNLPRVAPSGGVLIRSKGMSIDRARELAAEAGYFHDAPPELGGDHITEDDMLQLIEHAVSTPHYARGDLETATAREVARARQTQFAAARETIANTLDTHGIAFTPVEHLRAADWVASGELTPEAAIARVVNEHARDALDAFAQEAENTRYADLADEFEHTLAARDHGAGGGVDQSGISSGLAGGGRARGEQPGGAAADAREEAGLNGPVLAEAPGPSLDDPNGPAGKAIAESLTHDVKAQIAEDVAFTTAKGSTYLVHSDGSTSRDKSFHPEHGAKDQGPQPRSQATIYVSASDAVKLAEFQAQGGPKVAIAVTSDGRWGVKYLEGKDVGRFERRTVVAAFKQPAVGLTPVEIWKDGERVHFGNEITEIRRGRDQHAAALDPNFPARERQRAQLKADSPIRAKTDQESTIGAPLFDAVDQGNMFRLEEGGPLRSAEDVLRELDADDAAIKAARNCL
jgi:hypothetical protein